MEKMNSVVKINLEEDRNGLWWVEVVYSNGFVDRIPEPFDTAADAYAAVVHQGQHE